MAKTPSMVIPYRNRSVDVFELSLLSLERQTVPLNEIILVNVSSDEDWGLFTEEKLGKAEEYDRETRETE